MEGATEVCSKAGMLEENDSCNTFILNFHNIDITKGRVQKLMGSLNKADLRCLKFYSMLAQQEMITRKNGYSIGEMYWAKVFSPKYQSSYFKVIVLAATENYVYIESEFKGKPFYGTLLKESLLTEEEWEKVKAKLPKVDPNYHNYSKYIKVEKEKLFVEKKKRGRKKKSSVENTLDKLADDILRHDAQMDDSFYTVSDKGESSYDANTNDMGMNDMNMDEEGLDYENFD